LCRRFLVEGGDAALPVLSTQEMVAVIRMCARRIALVWLVDRSRVDEEVAAVRSRP
jgi:hypothetical protein